MFPCPYCSNFHGRNFKKLLSHIKFFHSHEPNFSAKCGFCGQTFKKFNSFKSHIQRKHSAMPPQESENDTLDFDDSFNSDDWNDDELQEEYEEETRENHRVDNMTRNLALFLLKTKEENQISQTAMNYLLENTSDLVESSLNTLKSQITACLDENGLDVSSIEGLQNVLEQKSLYSQAHQRLRSEQLQIKYFVENFNVVEPEEIVLSQHAEYRYVNGKQKLVLVKDAFHYIPIKKTLQGLLNQPEVLSQVRNSHCSTDGILRDWCDGECYHEHSLFGQNPSALILNCYYDDFQVTNPLGSKTKKHKIGAFYFTLGNLSPQYRSVVNIIQLVALCRVPLINKYGMNRILQPFLQDLQELESDNGVTLNVEGQDRTFQGSIGPYSCDNLGAHGIGGFSESFNALRICRICMATKEQIQTMFSENQFQLRTRESYNQHCTLIQNDPSLASTYGIKRKSALNNSRYFHAVDGLVLDIMHDQLEGVLPLDLKLLLQWCIQEQKYLTLDIVNTRLERFCYPASDLCNKPSQLKQQALANDSASLSQSAAQMWCLARILPLLIGDLIPRDDERWDNFLCLLQIEEIIFAPQTTPQLAAYLAILVEEYLREFGNLYERPMIPKQHYMVHYPTQILRYGPLVRNWAMRFEAKHNYFKKLVYKINNFKNITYSLARRHQALQAYLLQSTNGNFLRMALEVGPGILTSVEEAQLEGSLQQVDPNISPNSTLTRTSWVKVYGTKYTKGSILVIATDHGVPIFGEVEEILVVDGSKVFFHYNIVRVIEFVRHINAYKVTRTNEAHFILQSALLDYYPLGITKGFGLYSNSLFIILKYRID